MDKYQAVLPRSLRFVLRAMGSYGCDLGRGGVGFDFQAGSLAISAQTEFLGAYKELCQI